MNASWAGRGVGGLGLHLGGLRAGETRGAGDDEVNVVGVAAFNVVRHKGNRNRTRPAIISGHMTTAA